MGAAELFEDMEDLRSLEPVVWAVIQGAHTEARICDILNWPPKRVREHIAGLEEEKILYWMGGKTLVLNTRKAEEDPVVRKRMKMRELAAKIREKIVEEIPDMPDFKREKAANARAGKSSGSTRDPMALTDKQRQDLVLAYEIVGNSGKSFRALEVAKRKGFSSAGFTANTLVAIERKGYILEVSGAKLKSYTITEKGRKEVS